MKIAYVVAEGLDKEHGVSKKVLNQIKYWVNSGHSVKLFNYSNKGINPMFEEIEFEIIKYRSRIQFVLNTSGIVPINNWKPDIIYFRTYPYSNTFYKMLKTYPTVIEINSDDVEESKIHMPFLARKHHLLTRNFLMNNAKGFICVTNELKKKLIKYNKPTITIPNGINSHYISRKPEQNWNRNVRYQVIFLGSPNQSWHGLDKIISLANQLPEFDFHIVGTDGLKNMPNNLKQYGYLKESEYISIINKCDVAIGTLALHRIGMNEACPLKTREYLKYGLPTIIGYQDSDFIEGNYPFLFELPNKEGNIESNISSIKEFIENSRNICIGERDVEHLFYEYKEIKRLDFLSSLI
ncbi:glycosyltransferase [Neobacillus sp. PS3-34]|uniref:glycosyltransferase n=1 Tax=Neobacillus sp. PS3-34 TaxID=3070678 RepID=UPI0027E1F917|nr:glycosyltransferase [Neobacillus sp. PS3-34]WML46679.1 glycosyltransferase [Neobacillus sp. PS3-34]